MINITNMQLEQSGTGDILLSNCMQCTFVNEKARKYHSGSVGPAVTRRRHKMPVMSIEVIVRATRHKLTKAMAIFPSVGTKSEPKTHQSRTRSKGTAKRWPGSYK